MLFDICNVERRCFGFKILFIIVRDYKSRTVCVELSAWVFMIAGGVVIAVAFVTLSFQTIKATMTNPVDEIRNE